mmetsp:Transcript_155340/g.377361  ORF Transcript_155340/g.377361 Transcript_155340/m.377361 type:complete len:161 (+) Transcript_155340:108-590(+)
MSEEPFANQAAPCQPVRSTPQIHQAMHHVLWPPAPSSLLPLRARQAAWMVRDERMACIAFAKTTIWRCAPAVGMELFPPLCEDAGADSEVSRGGRLPGDDGAAAVPPPACCTARASAWKPSCSKNSAYLSLTSRAAASQGPCSSLRLDPDVAWQTPGSIS